MAITISGSGITSANIADGTIVDEDVADVAASKLTGALPAIDGSALTNLSAGKVLQVVSYRASNVGTTTSTIPMDDTVPQISEGTEYMTLAITPTSASSKLFIQVYFYGQMSPGNWYTWALFQDSTANALAAQRAYQATSTAGFTESLNHYMTAGTTSATTFRLRVGSGGTFSFNSDNGSRLYGGVMASGITITEIEG